MRHGWVREVAGWLSAAAIAVIVTGQVVSTARGELLLRDGDSLVVPMFVRSVLEGQGWDWAMSTVLFLPESALFALLHLVLPIGIDAVMLVNAAVNVLALYGAIRFVAGRRDDGRAPVAWSVIAVAVFGLLAVTEVSASRDSLELASLLLTTTYYSATVIAVVVSIGIARRLCDRPGSRRGMLIALAAVAAVASLSNPLYLVWATVPLGAVLGFAALRENDRARMLSLLWWLLGGTAVGLLGRIPFSAWIENSGLGYARPQLWPESAQYYGDLLTQRLSTPLGWVAAAVIVALLVLAVRRTLRASSRGERLVAASAWMLPVLVVVGAIALGTNAARYLEPVVFAPILALVAAPRTLRFSPAVRRTATAAAAVLLLVGAGLNVPRSATAATAPDADLACVTDWIDESGQTGAGQFWTVRLPKLHLADPTQLIQVDHRLNGYSWLVNRADFDTTSVSFLLADEKTQSWEVSLGTMEIDVVDCGRYTIYDLAPEELPLGFPHS
ncbi:hypothetical protein [Microbacterium sp. CIAB417]|uniref:hypothetical protein n=1 Tax=Microbacterium sp. CIAB417 TaxID=2860287 RepID=UPI001FADCAC3|nr:hypothetical protein [Microbacterium sp. CIAB417]